jgi:hypothetical protein
MSAPIVSALFLHPVKSCRPRSVERAALDDFGLVGDRRFMIVDDRGRFLTQRTTPRLALIEVAPSPDGGRLMFSAPEFEPLEVATRRPDPHPVEVIVWQDTVQGIDLGGAIASWLTAFLDQPARLVAMAPGFARRSRRAGDSNDQVSFADAFPVLVIAEASLADLNARLDFALPMDRFRPNIVINGCAPYAEDRFQGMRIGSCMFRAAGPCGRCVVTTTDPHTLERGKEPLHTLATYRKRADGQVVFGQNCVNESKSGEITVGMSVQFLEERDDRIEAS